MTGPRLVVFDVDGTLIDSQHVILAAMRQAFARIDAPPPPDADILGIVGLSLPEAMAVLAPHLSLDDRTLLGTHYRASFMEQRAQGLDQPPLYPGAQAALLRLDARPGTILGVATGKARRGLDHVFATHGLARFFATAQTADLHPSKPHPAMLVAALAETGCDPARAVMVGDTEFDMAMGRTAGVSTIGVAWGYHPRARLEASGAQTIIAAFGELDAALDALVP